jgi:hypothetical protein
MDIGMINQYRNPENSSFDFIDIGIIRGFGFMFVIMGIGFYIDYFTEVESLVKEE